MDTATHTPSGRRRPGSHTEARHSARGNIAGEAPGPQRVHTRKALQALYATLALALAASASAHAAGAINVSDEGHLHYLHSRGNEIIDEGQAKGSIPGRVNAQLTYTGNPNVTARFTLYAHSGTISGYAKGHLSNPNSSTPSFSGALTLTGGAGHYAHARGSGELYGVFDRRNYSMIVQTRGHITP
jgi:hypothetical protein